MMEYGELDCILVFEKLFNGPGTRLSTNLDHTLVWGLHIPHQCVIQIRVQPCPRSIEYLLPSVQI